MKLFAGCKIKKMVVTHSNSRHLKKIELQRIKSENYFLSRYSFEIFFPLSSSFHFEASFQMMNSFISQEKEYQIADSYFKKSKTFQ